MDVAILLPLQTATFLIADNITGDNEENEMILNIVCNITRDCLITIIGTIYVWALMTTIYRWV